MNTASRLGLSSSAFHRGVERFFPTKREMPTVHINTRMGIRKKLAYSTPCAPKTSDTMGRPAFPAFENIVANSSTARRMGDRLRHKSAPSPQADSTHAAEINSIRPPMISASSPASCSKAWRIMQGRVTLINSPMKAGRPSGFNMPALTMMMPTSM